MTTFDYMEPNFHDEHLRPALDEFEDALYRRYIDDLELQRVQVWTPDGYFVDDRSLAEQIDDPTYTSAKSQGWAAEVRTQLEDVLGSMYDTQDLTAIEAAFDSLKSTAAALTEGDSGSSSNPDLIEDRDALGFRAPIDPDFLTWSGAAGDLVRDSFLAYIPVTIQNQGFLAEALAKLYALRASIIEVARSNAIAAITSGTAALQETEVAPDDLGKIVDFDLGKLGYASYVPNSVGKVVGKAFLIKDAVGIFWDLLGPTEAQRTAFGHTIESAVAATKEAVRAVIREADRAEERFHHEVRELQDLIAGLSNSELELYDFSGHGVAEGSTDGFVVDLDEVKTLVAYSSRASRDYEPIISRVVATDDADAHLRGRSSEVTSGDAELLDLREALLSFLKTTSARFYEAASRMAESGRQYLDIEDHNKALMRAIGDAPDLNGTGADHPGNGKIAARLAPTAREDIEDGDR